MNIYFCDICMARVTDSHLRRAHGLLVNNQVICGSCVEKGHGSAIMRSAQVTAPEPLAGENVIDEARDRLQTMKDLESDYVEESEEEVKEDVTADVEDVEDIEELEEYEEIGGEENEEESLESDDLMETRGHDTQAAPQVVSAAKVSVADDEDDLVDQSEFNTSLEDEDGLPEIVSDQNGADGTDTYSTEDIKRARGDRERKKQRQNQSSGRRKTASGRRSTKSGTGDKSVSSERRAAKKGSSKQARAGSSRRGAATKKSNMPLIVTICGVGLIALIGIVYLTTAGGNKGPQEAPKTVHGQAENSIQKAYKSMIAAMRNNNDLAEFQEADHLYKQALKDADAFIKHAESENWTETQMEAQLKQWDFYDMKFQHKAIREKIVELQARK